MRRAVQLTGLAAAVLALFCGCGSGKPKCSGASECLDPNATANSRCQHDADCGDGICQADGTCRDRYAPADSATQCQGVSCQAGFFCANGKCLPENPQCKAPDPACIFIPQGAFEPPVHAWWWPWLTPAGPDAVGGKDAYRTDLQYPNYVQVMMTPVVMRLNPKDVSPAVVFNSFSDGGSLVETQGVMRAVSGVDGSPIWTAPRNFVPGTSPDSVDANSQIAAGDCLGTGEACFVAGAWDPNDPNHLHGGLVAFGSDGRTLWVNRDMQVWWGGPAIARLLGPTGPSQIVVGNGVVDGATGKTLCAQTQGAVGGNGDGPLSIVADIDLDGQPEIVLGNQAYKLLPDGSSPTGYTCKAIWGAGVKTSNGAACPGGVGVYCGDGFPAVASFKGYSQFGYPADDHPQVVVVSHGTLRIQDWTGGMLLSPIPIPANSANCNGIPIEGGAPTIADFDGDGLPEIGIAAQSAYAVYKPGKGWLWQQPTQDCSSNTGSSVFDFEGKGKADVIYGDECYVRVYEGATGKVLAAEKNSSCTAYEMPVVADIDGSGRARVVVPANTVCNAKCDWGTQYFSRIVGLKALASPDDKWVNTRSVWNEHSYHISNVNLDGTLPYPEPNSWQAPQTNTFRQNIQGQGMFSAPDLSACEVRPDMTHCDAGSAEVHTTVYNGGALVAKAGVSVRIYEILPDASQVLVGEAFTTKALQPGDSEDVVVMWNNPPKSVAVQLKTVVDEPGKVGDCHLDNNTTLSPPIKCGPLG